MEENSTAKPGRCSPRSAVRTTPLAFTGSAASGRYRPSVTPAPTAGGVVLITYVPFSVTSSAVVCTTRSPSANRTGNTSFMPHPASVETSHVPSVWAKPWPAPPSP